jgi:glycosyltransferase involved in cell wall biosynthesis
MRELKVLYITLRADHGGGPKHLLDLLSGLDLSISAFVACPAEPPYHRLFTDKVGESRVLEVPHRKFSLRKLLELCRFCVVNGIDIIHSHGKGAGIYSRLVGLLTARIVVHTYHGIHVNGMPWLPRVFYQTIEATLGIITNAAVAVSETEARVALSQRFINRSRLHVIFNGVAEDPAMRRETPTRSTKVISTVTRFDYAKNPDLLLSVIFSLKDNPEWRFVIIGDGDGRVALQREIAEASLSDRVNFTGFVDNPRQLIAESTFYLSTSRWEGLPLSVLEAMSLGIPPVLTRVTGNLDCISDGVSGIFYSEHNPQEAINKILNLGNNPEAYTAMSKAARLEVKNRFSVHSMTEQTLKLYHDVACTKGQQSDNP